MNKRILIVDDSPMMRKMISKILQTSGHIVVGEAKSGPEALVLYKSLSPDIVTMDITMRNMDGFAAAQEIIGFDKAAQIIFLSNLDAKKHEDDLECLNSLGYVNKNSLNQIIDIIEKT